MGKVAQTNTDLRNHLDEQLAFLQLSAKSYDDGFTGEAKRLAVALRVLLHDTSQSHSLLKQLGVKANLQFCDLALDLMPANLLTQPGLTAMRLSNEGAEFVPYLDDLPGGIPKPSLRFDNWWRRPVILDNKGNVFSRSDLVLGLTNQDGGAHVDPQLDEQYASLTREHSIGWRIQSQGNIPVEPLVPASVRQIAHEAVSTLVQQLPALVSSDHAALCGCGEKHFDPCRTQAMYWDGRFWRLDCAYERYSRDDQTRDVGQLLLPSFHMVPFRPIFHGFGKYAQPFRRQLGLIDLLATATQSDEVCESGQPS